MASGVYKVTWGGPGNIVWEKLGESVQQIANVREVVSISSSVAAASSTIGAGLSLVSVIQNAMILTKLSSLQNDVSNMKARFDLLFLDRSLDYFESAHDRVLGVDANIAEALQQDCLNALAQLVQDKSLSVPAFLRHRCLAFTGGINQFSQLLYAMLHEGNVNLLEGEAVRAWTKKISSLQGVSPDGGYVSQSDLLLAWTQELSQREFSKKSGSLVERFSSKDQAVVDEACSHANFERCSEVLSLFREIEAYIRYCNILSAKPAKQNDRALVFKLVG